MKIWRESHTIRSSHLMDTCDGGSSGDDDDDDDSNGESGNGVHSYGDSLSSNNIESAGKFLQEQFRKAKTLSEVQVQLPEIPYQNLFPEILRLLTYETPIVIE